MKEKNEGGTGSGELLSRLMDEPLGDFELRRLLAEVEKSPDSDLHRWRRYQTMRAVMRGDETVHHTADLSVSVRQALAAEEAHGAQPGDAARLSGWGGFAVAASVMFAAVLLVQTLGSGTGGDAPEVAQSTPAPAVVARSAPPATEVEPVVARQPEIIRAPGDQAPVRTRQPQPNVYLVRHAEFSTFAGSGAIMPYARLATSDGNP